VLTNIFFLISFSWRAMPVLTPLVPLHCKKQLKKWSVMAAGNGCGDGKDGSAVVVVVAAKFLAVASGGGGSYSSERQ
jgi:hypothetical protein